MVSDRLVRNIVIFAAKHKIQYQEVNERPWGSFEPLLSLDGETWWRPNELFGWGFTPPQVVAEVLVRRSTDPNLRTWLGEEILCELLDLIIADHDMEQLEAPKNEQSG
jgi:hypothetical protein